MLNSHRFSKELDCGRTIHQLQGIKVLSLIQESLGHREPIFTFALLFERGGCYAPFPGTAAGLSRPLATLSAILLLDRSLFGEALVFPWFFPCFQWLPCLSTGNGFFYWAWLTLPGSALFHMLLSYCILHGSERANRSQRIILYIFAIRLKTNITK